MSEVLVRRCRIRVVRRGGWSWGPEPRALLDRVLKLFPGLIGAELETLLADDGGGDREIASPVRITVPLRLSALRGAGPAAELAAQLRSELSGRVAGALRRALAHAGVEFTEPGQESEVAPRAAAAVAETPSARIADPLGVLIEHARRGRLQHYLSGFSLAALRTWHDWIARARPLAASSDGIAAAAIEPTLTRLAAHFSGPAADETETLRRRMTAFVAVESTLPHALSIAAVRDAIERITPSAATHAALLPASASAPSGDLVAEHKTPVSFATAMRPIQPRADFAAPTAMTFGKDLDVHIESVLPFLLLGPLARVGYLEAVSATFEAADTLQDLPLFALALAYKVLSTPARGWLRSPASLASAAAFGLYAQAPADAVLAAMVRRIGPFTSSLDGVIATSLIEGHRPGTSLLVTSVRPERLLLSDVDGVFPIQAGAAKCLANQLKHLPQDMCLVEASAASPDTLTTFHHAGVRFITDTQPCRGEAWRAVLGRPGERWWSNDMSTEEGRLAFAARKLGAAAQDADAYWRAVGIERPSVPRDGERHCDDALTLAAGVALATIAWELWREREPTSPLLALERLGDLDGRVRVDPARVRVSLPLGRRFRDLSEHGLLNDLSGVPWFGGRMLSFASG